MNGTSRLAIDVGGTFTDVVELRAGRLRFDKVPTTPQAPTEGVLNAVDVAEAGAAGVTMFTHGTTLGLNALLTRIGAHRRRRDGGLPGRLPARAHRPSHELRHHLPPRGVGVSRSYRFTAPSTGICLVYKTRTKPWPIGGGRAGENNRIVLNPGSDLEVVQGGS
jgi:N-methylhydantoinase A/oxoprolinase/acetone carboxylase beta subunit